MVESRVRDFPTTVIVAPDGSFVGISPAPAGDDVKLSAELLALLSGAVFTGGVDIQGVQGFRITNVAPIADLIETDAPADQQIYRAAPFAGNLYVTARNDDTTQKHQYARLHPTGQLDLAAAVKVWVPESVDGDTITAARSTATASATGRVAVNGAEIGATGVRDVSADIGAGFTVGSMRIQREGNVVELAISALATTAAQGIIYAIPAGFRPSDAVATMIRPTFHTTSAPADIYRSFINSTSLNWSGAAGVTVYGSVVYVTADAWPATLPGT